MARLLSVLSVLLWNIQQRKLRLSLFEQHGVAFPPAGTSLQFVPNSKFSPRPTCPICPTRLTKQNFLDTLFFKNISLLWKEKIVKINIVTIAYFYIFVEISNFTTF
nr:hypothetical protein [Capnocytophaga sputigena]